MYSVTKMYTKNTNLKIDLKYVIKKNHHLYTNLQLKAFFSSFFVMQ